MNLVFTTEKRLAYYDSLNSGIIAAGNYYIMEIVDGAHFSWLPLIGIQSYIFGSLGVFFRLMIIASAILFAWNVKYSGWFLATLLVIGFADDFNRLTPNTYQYCIVAVLFAITGSTNASNLSGSIKIIQAGFYLWTGILKLSKSLRRQISDFICSLFISTHLPIT